MPTHPIYIHTSVCPSIQVSIHKHLLEHSTRKVARKRSKKNHSSIARCGPDVTHWLVRQMNHNKDHHVITRCGSWAGSWIWPWCLREFANLVGKERPWDFKYTQTFHRGSCPHRCPETVTLCNQCVFHDVPGNIHYGYVGRAAAFQRLLLQFAAHRVQKGGIDDPKDQNAIRIGMDLWDHTDRRDHFCHEVHKHALSKHHTSGCHTCSTRY